MNEKKHFHVKGQYSYYIVERTSYTVSIDETVEADNADDALDVIIEELAGKHDGEGEFDEAWRKLETKEVELSPPAEDVVLWSLPRDIAPTLFPIEVLQGIKG